MEQPFTLKDVVTTFEFDCRPSRAPGLRIRALARDLRHKPQLSAEDTKGLDELKKALKVSFKKDVGD